MTAIAINAAPAKFFDSAGLGKMRKRALELLEDHELNGEIPTSVRFIFYEMVARGWLSKEVPKRTDGKKGRRPDQNLADAIFDLREHGVIPWDWIVDETRALHSFLGDASTIKQAMLDILLYMTLDPWKGDVPITITESRSLAGVLRSLVQDYRTEITATNGQVGGFLRTKIAPALWVGRRVLYMGDLDLCGGQIEENTRRVLERLVGGQLRWERLALTEEQVAAHRLPKIIKHDKRYTDGKPHEAVETEALKQRVIVGLLRDRLDELLPAPLAAYWYASADSRPKSAACSMVAAMTDPFGRWPPDPVDGTIGMKVRLDRAKDHLDPCCENIAIVAQGKGPHAAQLCCENCWRHLGWLSKTTVNFLSEMVRLFGVPDEPFLLTDATPGINPMRKADALPSKYIRATDIGDREWSLTIVQTRMEKVGQDDTKPVMRFKEVTSGLALNVTNWDTLATAYGEGSNDWNGKTVVLYAAETMKGKPTLGTRIKIPESSMAAPPVKPKLVAAGGAPKQSLSMELDDEVPF